MSKSGSSFAERFGKKRFGEGGEEGGGSFADSIKRKSFTSENLKTQPPKPKEPIVDSPQQSNKKQIDPIKKMQAELIYLVKGIDAGRNAWYYVLVDRLKVQIFLKALNDEIIHLENYGKILFSAYGDEPPMEVTNQLKEEYGIS